MLDSLPTMTRSEAPVHPACDPALLRRLYDEAHDALRRYRGLSAPDLDDLTQRVVWAAVARLDTYRAGKGTLRQWIRGIVRHEVAFHGRTQARRQEHETDYAIVGQGSRLGARSPEDIVSMEQLCERLLEEVPVEDRKIVELVELIGLGQKEAALFMGISTTTAHTRYHRGVKAFREAAERWKEEQKRHGVIPLAFTIEQIFAAGRAPLAPEEDWARAWEHISSALSRESSQPDNDLEPPSGPSILASRKVRLLRMFGVGLLAVAAFGPDCFTRHARDERPVVVAVPETAGVAPPASVGVAATPPPRVEQPEPSSKEDAPPPPRIPATAAVRRRDHQRERAELLLLTKGRAALASGKPKDALAAYDQLVQRFPQAENAAARVQLQRAARACKGAPGASGSPTARCAGQP